jgi:hypothetical protein
MRRKIAYTVDERGGIRFCFYKNLDVEDGKRLAFPRCR